MTLAVAFAALLLTGLAAGGLAFMACGVTRATPELDAGVFVEVHQAVSRMADPLMPILVCLSGFSGAGLVAALLDDGAGLAAALASAGVVGVGSVIAISDRINKPMNRLVSTWSLERPPDQWAAVRDRWNIWHARRTACCLVAYTCELVAVLLAF